jgi:hypothetical protein
MIRDFLAITSPRALERVRPDWLDPTQAQIVRNCAARRKHREAEREIHGGKA